MHVFMTMYSMMIHKVVLQKEAGCLCYDCRLAGPVKFLVTFLSKF